MIGKISYGLNAHSVFLYNEKKVSKGEAEKLYCNNIITEKWVSQAQIVQAIAQEGRVEEPILHISINFPHEERSLQSHEILAIGQQYMENMGYAELPYVVYRHNDTKHQHIHIISSRVDENGKLINSRFEFKKNLEVCAKIEKHNNLVQLDRTSRVYKIDDEIKFDDSKKGTKAAIAKSIKQVKDHIHFKNFEQFRSALSIFNVTVKQVDHESRVGLVYILNEEGKEKFPIKASNIYHSCTFKSVMKTANKNEKKYTLKALQLAKKNVGEFIRKYETIHKSPTVYANENVVPIFATYKNGNIYGVSWLDKSSGNIYKASDLGPGFQLSAIEDRVGEELNYYNTYIKDTIIKNAFFALRKEDYNNQPKKLPDFIQQLTHDKLLLKVLDSIPYKNISDTHLSFITNGVKEFLKQKMSAIIEEINGEEVKDVIQNIINDEMHKQYKQSKLENIELSYFEFLKKNISKEKFTSFIEKHGVIDIINRAYIDNTFTSKLIDSSVNYNIDYWYNKLMYVDIQLMIKNYLYNSYQQQISFIPEYSREKDIMLLQHLNSNKDAYINTLFSNENFINKINSHVVSYNQPINLDIVKQDAFESLEYMLNKRIHYLSTLQTPSNNILNINNLSFLDIFTKDDIGASLGIKRWRKNEIER